jgi:c-di-GMP-binding flagellar brake protein YcgR
MPEVMRHIAARLRQLVGNRRSAARYDAQLHCSVSVLSRKAGANGAGRTPVLEGRTRDVSASGLGLVMPAIRIGEQYLTGEGRTLLIQLELPDGMIQMQAVAVRYERLEQDEARLGYFIGARITEMSDENRARFDAYLQSFKR